MADSPSGFDVVATYKRLLAADPEITMPVAAIESLVECLNASTASTVSETLDLLDTSTRELKARVQNSISLSAGTDLFQRYMIATLNAQRQHQYASPTPGGSSHDEFKTTRNLLIANGRNFVSGAKSCRHRIAAFGRHFVRDGATVLTNGGSRVVGALLRSAAEAGHGGSVRFRVIYALPSVGVDGQKLREHEGGEGMGIVADLRARGVPVATIPESAVGYALGKVDMVLVGAEGVVENGGIISRLGTYQMGVLAKAAGKPFYVVAESHKFVRLYPLGQYDLPIKQKIIQFKVAGEDGAEDIDGDVILDEGVDMAVEGMDEEGGAVDFTVSGPSRPLQG
jgi:translation initiation factor eIF-2B subunit alpha